MGDSSKLSKQQDTVSRVQVLHTTHILSAISSPPQTSHQSYGNAMMVLYLNVKKRKSRVFKKKKKRSKVAMDNGNYQYVMSNEGQFTHCGDENVDYNFYSNAYHVIPSPRSGDSYSINCTHDKNSNAHTNINCVSKIA